MEIIYTARFLKDYNDIKEKRGKKDTDKVVSLIQAAPNFIELNKMLDVKKLNVGLGGYRIRYSNKPEYRIRFDIVDNKIELQLVLTREKYQKYAHRPLNESTESKPMTLIVTESQLRYLMEDYYDPKKLYSRDYIIDRLKGAPRYIKKIGDTLDYIKMTHKVTGEVKYFTYISQQLYQYLFGNY
jgi:mRNA-degrading endonuclease RelE of RelBE toxin-antitoxin system